MWKELLHKIKQLKTHTAWKATKYAVFSGPYFPEFRLNTERYGVSLRIQSECGKIQTRKNFVFGHFSRSVSGRKLIKDDIMTKKCGFILVFPVFLVLFQLHSALSHSDSLFSYLKLSNLILHFCTSQKNIRKYDPLGNYISKANNRNTRIWCEIFSKLTIKTT